MEKKITLLLLKEFPKLKLIKNLNIKKLKIKNIDGWDSLSSINFILKLEKKLKVKINILNILKLKTIEDLIEYVDKCQKN
jgi:acyl carrier protein